MPTDPSCSAACSIDMLHPSQQRSMQGRGSVNAESSISYTEFERRRGGGSVPALLASKDSAGAVSQAWYTMARPIADMPTAP